MDLNQQFIEEFTEGLDASNHLIAHRPGSNFT